MSNIITIESFFEGAYKQQAQNDNYSRLASCIDGLKPSSRKVLHTVIKNNITKWNKVEALANITAGQTEYLGGATNLYGVIVTISKSYVTSNNLPLLDTQGLFGKRLDNKAGAGRYIYVRKNENFSNYFIKEDFNVQIKQEFEGINIEDRFFIPILPILMINGSSGVGTGHAQLIAPRKILDIKNYIINEINNENNIELIPYWNGFKGKTYRGLNVNSWVTEGLYEINKKNITIYELPVGYTLLSYTKKLDKLESNGTIKSYKDLSNTKTDTFRFVINVDNKFDLSHENIINSLYLTQTFTENFTSIDENNSVKLFDSEKELISHYIKIRLEYYQKRKDYLIQKIKDDLIINESKHIFVSGVVDGSIVVQRKKKTEIETRLKSIGGIIKTESSYDYLLRMSISSLSYEKVQELKKKITSLKKELKEMSKKDIKEMWIEELDKIG